MLFPTFDFLLFVIPVLIGAWLLADKPIARVVFLLVASYFFYMAGPKTEPPPAPWYFAGLLLFSTLLDYLCGWAIFNDDEAADSDDEAKAEAAKRRRRRWLTLSLVGNLGVLGYFKYANFFLEAIHDVLSVAGMNVPTYRLDVILPLGISFYTFQSLSYTLDVYRGRMEPERNFVRFALFVVFFPQLVAGPIVRANQFLPQLREGPRFSYERFQDGGFRILKGLFKKVVLGDYIAVHFTDKIFDAPETFTAPELAIALYAYTLQIYADFSGYTDIAIGVGKMLGYELPENFNRPYQARDMAEYWRRWHMTLAGWLRDYLFFPVMARLGSRGGYFALWLTMFLVGMWHGASWNFVIYANLHAAAVVFNRWNRTRDREERTAIQTWVYWPFGVLVGFAAAAGLFHGVLMLSWTVAAVLAGVSAAVFLFVCWLPDSDSWINGAVHTALMFHFVVLSRIFFRAPDLDTARRFVDSLTDVSVLAVRPGLVSPLVGALLVGGLAVHFTPKAWVDEHLRKWFGAMPGVLQGAAYLVLLLLLAWLMDGAPRAFIYFQF